MAWVYLLLAGILEVIWAYYMKQSHGFTRLVPSAVTVVTMIASFGLLAVAMRSLPLGTAYTIWTGIGAVGAFIVGVVVLGEQLTAMRIGADRLGAGIDEAFVFILNGQAGSSILNGAASPHAAGARQKRSSN